jgi:hypothetical protein
MVAAMGYCSMYVIRLERGEVVMFLTTVVPVRWGERASAMRFATKGEARRAAGTIKIAGAWSIEDAAKSTE